MDGPTRLGHLSPSTLLLLLFLFHRPPNGFVQSCITLYANPLGVVMPSHDVTLEVGSPLAINCTIYPRNVDIHYGGVKGITSKNIRFKLAASSEKRVRWIPRDSIQLVDDFTAQLTIDNLTLTDSGKYSCYLTTEGGASKGGRAENRLVCATAITVGYAPLGVNAEDIDCISLNWQNLTCTWVTPKNPIRTTYKFYYSYSGHDGNYVECKPFKRQVNKCVLTVGQNDTANEGFYRQSSKYYHFLIRGDNMFGKSENTVQFNHFSYVVPDKPYKLRATNVQSTSMELGWLEPIGMRGFPVGLKYQVAFSSEYDDPDDVITLATTVPNAELGSLIPYANYVVKVRCASASAIDEYASWSENAVIQRRTEPALPETIPQTTLGLFEEREQSNLSRSITIYWKEVPKKFRNGDNFKYYVEYDLTMSRQKRTVSSSMEDDRARTTSGFYVRYDNLDLYSAYRFRIRVGNDEGSRSNVYSDVFVNDKDLAIGKATNFYAQLKANGSYRLSWKPPSTNAHLVESYTIFWCEQKPHNPSVGCKEPMDWKTVAGDRRDLTVRVPRVDSTYYQFAISSNGKRQSSSGMIWTACINRVGDKVLVVTVVDRSSTSLRVAWKSECIEENFVIKGYLVHYCLARNADDNSCKGPILKKRSKNDFAVLENLRTYSRYIVRVSYVHDTGLNGELSDPVSETTSEGVPDEVGAPMVLSVTNSSIDISWEATPQTNGQIVRYEVRYGARTKALSWTPNTKLETRLSKGIRPFTRYEVSISACTVIGCSSGVNFAIVDTLVGVPGRMEAPRYVVINSTVVRVYWSKPLSPNGPIDMVEVNVTWTVGRNETRHYRYNLTNWMNTTDIVIGCVPYSGRAEDDLHTYNVSVRSINIAQDGRRLFGPWSKVASIATCFDAADAMAIGFIIGVTVGGSIAVTVLLLLLYLIIKWMLQKMDEAKAIKVQLPKGLESNGMTSLNTYRDFSNGLKAPRSPANSISSSNFSQYKPLIQPNVSSGDLKNGEIKNRHESGDSAYSSNSTQELLRKHGKMDRSVSVESGDGESTNMSAKGHLSNNSNDSGLHCDLDSSSQQPSPEPSAFVSDQQPNNPWQKKQSSPQGGLKFKAPSLPIVDESRGNESSPDDKSEKSDDSGTTDLLNNHRRTPPPYCKMGINNLRGAYVPTHPATASFLGKNARKIAGSEPNIADVQLDRRSFDRDSGNSSAAAESFLPPYARIGLASSHTDVSQNFPPSYSKVGFVVPSSSSYVSSNSFGKFGKVSPVRCAAYPVAPYSKFGLLNIPTTENVNNNPRNPYLSSFPVQKWDIPKPRITVFFDFGEGDDKNAVPEMAEGYSRVSAAPQDVLPVPRDVDRLDDYDRVLFIQSGCDSTQNAPKMQISETGAEEADGGDFTPSPICVDENAATSTPKSSPQPSNRTTDDKNKSVTNGYVTLPTTAILNPSKKKNDEDQPLSCANLPPSQLTII